MIDLIFKMEYFPNDLFQKLQIFDVQIADKI